LWLVLCALFGATQIRDIAVDSCDQLNSICLKLIYEFAITKTLIEACVEVINQLSHGATGSATKLGIFLVVLATMAFRDVV
jgi:hypothetical protein